MGITVGSGSIFLDFYATRPLRLECETGGLGQMLFQGCEVVISGKLRGQRAKAMKFTDGLMIHTGHPVTEYVDVAVRHVLLRQGVIGLKVGFAIF